ncbi:hypothetical protein B0E52_05585 [Rhodanobacter sp. C06]|uniref:hypothetical protein n=1 Tax=Rhodanobacter sp. C06 TaxID=1945854 RepID=UPI000986F92F|nr:hypothetical protein [Rhodanobacter sp. C06]OOG45204.1 hypothetical protein B0E52_05585 [Rhodanobacter sp. C06]
MSSIECYITLQREVRMGVCHLISVAEDQLRSWRGDHDELLRDIGSAVVLACLDTELTRVTVRGADAGSPGGTSGSAITVQHVGAYDGDDFTPWVWASGDEIRLTGELERADLVRLGKLINAVLANTSVSGGES